MKTRIRRLSDRERQVLKLVLEGGTYAAIGERLGISEKTVSAHVQAMAARCSGPGKPRMRLVRHGEEMLLH